MLGTLDHPHLAAINAVRELIHSAHPSIQETVKWNAPSFYTTEHFATLQLRYTRGVQVVLHLGAKPQPDAAVRDGVPDPGGLLEWRGADRAIVTFRDVDDVHARRDAFVAIVRAWITFVA